MTVTTAVTTPITTAITTRARLRRRGITATIEAADVFAELSLVSQIVSCQEGDASGTRRRRCWGGGGGGGGGGRCRRWEVAVTAVAMEGGR